MSKQYQQTNGVQYLHSNTATAYHTVDICEVNISPKDPVPRFWLMSVNEKLQRRKD